jgi:hypothetical protein
LAPVTTADAGEAVIAKPAKPMMAAQAKPLKVFDAQPRWRTRVITVDCISGPFMFARCVVDARSEVSVSTSSLLIAVLGLDFGSQP